MKKLDLAQRPQPDSPWGLFILFVVAAIIEIALGAGIPLGADAFFCVLFGSATAIMTTILPFIFRAEARDKRNWPEKIEAFLNQELSEKDYQALYKTARSYPAIRAMIAAAMKDGKLYYREAEGLAGQINALLADNSKGRRKAAGSPRHKLGKLVGPPTGNESHPKP
jgi:hypothetical protein